MDADRPSGKLPGKTRFSGRRRTATRVSGFKSHPNSTGGEFQWGEAPAYQLSAGDVLVVTFALPAAPPGAFIAFGGWYYAPDNAVNVSLVGPYIPTKKILTPPAAPNWSKFGSMWRSSGKTASIEFRMEAQAPCEIALWEVGCGVVQHRHFDNSRPELLTNMHLYSPEAHFYKTKGTSKVQLEGGGEPITAGIVGIPRKSCNRCARFLPINLENERLPLSFSNHCVAAHRRPCKHSGFGRLRNVDDGTTIQLEYGYQLECRFCKKFEVNAAHNPQRTAAQMKEDAARRRSFELLLAELYGESAQLRYRHKTGRELAEDVWERFGGVCFNCEKDLKVAGGMHLDHTRPLALLWPLDGTATALCGGCNSAKRDRPPSEFYTNAQLTKLATITRIPLPELIDPSPNIEAVRCLRDRLDWFFDEFLNSPELLKVRDGKATAELLCKALQKAINRCPRPERFNLLAEYKRRCGV